MSSTHVTAELRRLVVSRADSLCEYCLVHADDAFFGCEVDHTLSEIGEVTVRILGFNQPEQVMERESLRSVGRYPVPAALKRMRALD